MAVGGGGKSSALSLNFDLFSFWGVILNRSNKCLRFDQGCILFHTYLFDVNKVRNECKSNETGETEVRMKLSARLRESQTDPGPMVPSGGGSDPSQATAIRQVFKQSYRELVNEQEDDLTTGGLNYEEVVCAAVSRQVTGWRVVSKSEMTQELVTMKTHKWPKY